MDFLISGVFDDRGQDLTFEANLHLFLWDGEIVARESPHDRAITNPHHFRAVG